MTNALLEGVSVMLVGMGTVLVFLCIMIISMHLMSAGVKYLNKFFPEPVAVQNNGKSKKVSNNDEEIALAIATAMFAKK